LQQWQSGPVGWTNLPNHGSDATDGFGDDRAVVFVDEITCCARIICDQRFWHTQSAVANHQRLMGFAHIGHTAQQPVDYRAGQSIEPGPEQTDALGRRRLASPLIGTAQYRRVSRRAEADENTGQCLESDAPSRPSEVAGTEAAVAPFSVDPWLSRQLADV